MSVLLSQQQSDEVEIVEETSDDIPPEFFEQLAAFDESYIMNSIVEYCGLDSDSSEEINLESSHNEIITLRNIFGV